MTAYQVDGGFEARCSNDACSWKGPVKTYFRDAVEAVRDSIDATD